MVRKLWVLLFGEAKQGPKGKWAEMWAKLWVLIPTKVLQWLEEGREKHQKHPLLYIMTALIVALAMASMWNFITRAETHHEGFSAWLGGSALAGLVPVTVFFAVYAPLTVNQRKGTWVIAGVFVFISASIQFPVYAGVPLTWGYIGSDKFNLEALAFGAGNPIAECLLAVMEAMYLNSLAKKEAEKQTKAQEEAKAQEAAERLAKEEAERKAKEEAEAAIKRQHEEELFKLELELKRAEALAKLEFKRIEVEAKAASKTLSTPSKKLSNAVELDSGGYENTPVETVDKPKTLTKTEALDILLDAFKKNPKLSYREAGKLIGKSKDTVGNYLKELQDQNKVSVNGEVKVL